ncbi:MAG: methyltransferase domain-containing protein, partial [Candidatus Omnitrophota bacterium]|nr:methyltransferase domain-containing protein [Candidatus Omnitrophota bacterium]
QYFSLRSGGSMTQDNQDFNIAYVGNREDVLRIIPENVRKVLDVGCSIGKLGEQLKRRFKSEVVGIEIDEKMAEVAKEKLDKVIVGDLDEISLKEYLAPNYFDCIIFADILEHLKDPWKVLKDTTAFLNSDGIVVASIPNVRHYTTIINLLFLGRWPYRERGLHDKMHLRFFTLEGINELFHGANLEIIQLKRNFRIIERPHVFNNRFAKYFRFTPLRELFVFQYLAVAKKQKKMEEKQEI